MMTAREAALKAVAAFRKSDSWSSIYLGGLIDREKLEPREAALASNICAGVLQNLYLCDFYISKFLNTKPEKLEPLVLDILRISVYQIVFLTRIPDSAAVNEGVALAKRYTNIRASGLVNAVLRKIATNRDRLPPVKCDTLSEELSIKYSHPLWLVNELLSRLGQEECEAFLKSDNTPPVICAQVNTLKADPDSVLGELKESGVMADRHPWLPDCLMLGGVGNVEKLGPFADGRVYIQDPAAKLAVLAAAPKPGDACIDGCAAPGGKSFASAIAMKNKGRILACDIHENKLGLITSGAKRLGISIIEAKAQDGRAPAEELFRSADVVLADVPCSGLGVIRKKPEIRYKAPEKLAGLPDIQFDILKNLAGYVRPGGCLLYSTCTILERENEAVIDRFLGENTDFEPAAFTVPGPAGKATGGMLTLWPQRHGTDGFFICKLRRRG